jgi:putative RNA 2'-phosphotransferase
MNDTEISKALSYWLRHAPEAAGLALDAQGWTDTGAVMAALQGKGAALDFDRLVRVVELSDKQRFELSADAGRIRARQGHSVAVDLDLPPVTPPDVLYHGTVERFLDAILSEGLKPQARHHVHLSADLETANKVGQRRGKPVILTIDAAAMAAEGAVFFVTSNQVWLTDNVPPGRLSA